MLRMRRFLLWCCQVCISTVFAFNLVILAQRYVCSELSHLVAGALLHVRHVCRHAINKRVLVAANHLPA